MNFFFEILLNSYAKTKFREKGKYSTLHKPAIQSMDAKKNLKEFIPHFSRKKILILDLCAQHYSSVVFFFK
jgi:hypothetical protein